jgi:hypothetical protein
MPSTGSPNTYASVERQITALVMSRLAATRAVGGKLESDQLILGTRAEVFWNMHVSDKKEGISMNDLPGAEVPSGPPLRLLQSVPGKVYSRLIVRYPYQTDSDYAFYYHESANRLASTYTGKAIDDVILMPFLMLYRQAFELQLKGFIRHLASVRRRYHEPTNLALHREEINERLRSKLGHNLAKLLGELLKHYDALKLSEAFPESVKKLVLMMHEADGKRTAFRYGGLLPDSQDSADFPDLVEMFDKEFKLLCAGEDWVESIYDAVPEPEEL